MDEIRVWAVLGSKENRYGTRRVKIKISSGNKKVEKSLPNIFLVKKQWDKRRCRVKKKKCKFAPRYNKIITSELNRIEKEILDSQINGTQYQLSSSFKSKKSKSFLGYYESIIIEMEKLIKSGNNEISINTKANYTTCYNVFKRFLKELELDLNNEIHKKNKIHQNLEFHEITDSIDDAYKEWLHKKYRDNSVKNIYGNAKTICKRYKKNVDKSYVIPFQHTINRTPSKKKAKLTSYEISAFEKLKPMSNFEEMVQDSFLLACCIGMRIGDILSIEKSNFENRNTFNPKTSIEVLNTWIKKKAFKSYRKSKEIDVPLNKMAEAIYKKYKDTNSDSVYLFDFIGCKKLGLNAARDAAKKMTRQYNKVLFSLNKRAGINKKVTSHVGRNTFINSIKELKMASMLVNHSSEAITEIYRSTEDWEKLEALGMV